MKFKLEITCDNAAFHDSDKEFEVARLLRNAGNKVEKGAEDGVLLDINGNTVGTFEFTGE